MGFKVRNVAIDCADPYALAQFWSAVMESPNEYNSPGDPVAIVLLEQGFALYFAQVPEPKTVKNRVHICLTPDERREIAVEHVLGLGGSIVDDRRNPDGTGWVVFADPEGNEFCVLRSEAERAEHAQH